MQTQCRFIPSSKLSKSELAYILLPDEVIGLFRRAKNPAAVLQSLPPSLRQTLAASAGKDLTQCLNQLRRELLRGRWVGLSIKKRNTPVRDQALAKLPVLQAKVQALRETEDKYIKANFKPGAEDVPLARVMEYVPVEPQPEHKIVIEFAGQWPANSASLYLGKTDAQDGKLAKPRADLVHEHRSIAAFKGLENEPKNLYLTVPLNGNPNPLKLLLAENITPVEKETEMDEWDNVLVPITPLAYIDDDQDPDKTAMYASGYFYIVWNNKVWRELKVTPTGYLQDVDLDYYRTREGKQAMAQKRDRYLDIVLICPATGFPEPEQRYEFDTEDGRCIRGVLDQNARAHIAGLTDEEITVRFPDYVPEPDAEQGYELTIATQLGEWVQDQSEHREAQGFPLPHIWLPYKLDGEAQTELALAYSAFQLNFDEISQLESDPESVDVLYQKIDGLELYSAEQGFDADSDSLFSAGSCTASDPASCFSVLQADNGLIDSHAGTNTAQWVTPPPPKELVIQYRFEQQCDQQDDYIELQDCDSKWRMRRTLGADGKTGLADTVRLLRFTPLPETLETVNLVRGRAGLEPHQTYYASVPLNDLMPRPAKNRQDTE